MQTKTSQEGEAAEAAMDSMDDRSHCILPPSGMVYCACSWHRGCIPYGEEQALLVAVIVTYQIASCYIPLCVCGLRLV